MAATVVPAVARPVQQTVFGSVARTTTPTAVQFSQKVHRGVRLVIDATAASATPSIVFTITGVDPLSGKKTTLLASAAVTGISTTELVVYPGCAAVANLVADKPLPATIEISAAHGDADSITYTVSAEFLP